ncbi:MAG: aspartate aminotransferase family protein [Flavobacteriales bacterium]|nr:aspartate aminotransferase family protein [Flavobacteriales bacterium]NNK80497.1 aspartate aminotransferase family protein [Flavobacteriales bacterium]
MKDHLALTSPHPLEIEVDKAEGVFVWDKEGKRYYDLIAGIAVNNVGHRHPAIVRAIKEQVDKYLHVIPYGEFIQEPQIKLAQALCEILPNGLDCSYFVNSGAEAIEASLKLAKRATGRTELMAFRRSYHGSTHGALSVTDNENKKYHARPLLPDVRFIDFDCIGCLHKITEDTAAVIIEPIQGDAGVRIASENYLAELRARCSQVGALLIFDEIQTGMGRTGAMFAFEHYHVSPDILCLAKALGGGMPIGAFIASKELMNLWTHNPMLGHITTFGGHPVNCAAALANVEILRNTDIISQVETKGALFEELLTHSLVKEIRRKGLMMALEFENPEIVQKIVHGCLEKGVITFWFLSDSVSFRIQPPLSISESEIREACSIIIVVLDEIH